LETHRARQLEYRERLGSVWTDLDLVFPSEVGTPGDHANVLHAFHKVTDMAHLPRLRVHDLRHTAATLMLLKGVPAKDISEMLGHASVAITLDLYSNVVPDMQDMAVAARRACLPLARRECPDHDPTDLVRPTHRWSSACIDSLHRS
jgi:integrase